MARDAPLGRPGRSPPAQVSRQEVGEAWENGGGPPGSPEARAPGEASDLRPFPGRVRAGPAFGNADEPPPGPGLNLLTQPPPAARAPGGGATSGGLPFSPGAPVHCAFGRLHLSSPTP